MNKPPTVSIERARALKEAGWKQNDCSHYWVEIVVPRLKREEPSREWKLLTQRESNEALFKFTEQKIAAPTAEEVLRELPVDVIIDGYEYRIEMLKRHGVSNDKYYVNYRYYTKVYEFMEDTLADATTSAWIYLKENNLLPTKP